MRQRSVQASARAKSRFFKAIRKQFLSLGRSCDQVENFNCELESDAENSLAAREVFARQAVSSDNANRVRLLKLAHSANLRNMNTWKTDFLVPKLVPIKMA